MKVVIQEKLYGMDVFIGQLDHLPDVGDFVDVIARRYKVVYRYFDIIENSVRISVEQVS